MAATKVAVAKKTPAKAAAPVKKAPAKAEAPAKRGRVQATEPADDESHLVLDAAFVKAVVKARDKDGLKWDEIAEQMESTPGKCILAHMYGTLPDEDKVTGTMAQRSKAIPNLRDKDLLSWGQISVRVDMPESRVRAVYRDLTGNNDRGNRVGRGGKYPADVDAPPRAKREKAPPKE